MKQEKQVTYHLSPDEVKEVLTDYLEARGKDVSVHFKIEEVGGDPMDRYPGVDTVTDIQVTVKEK